MALKDEKKLKQRTVMFSKESELDDEIDEVTSLIEKLATQASQIGSLELSIQDCIRAEVDPYIIL